MTDFVVIKTMLDLTVNKSCTRDITVPSTAGLISRVALKKNKSYIEQRTSHVTLFTYQCLKFSNRFPVFDLL